SSLTSVPPSMSTRRSAPLKVEPPVVEVNVAVLAPPPGFKLPPVPVMLWTEPLPARTPPLRLTGLLSSVPLTMRVPAWTVVVPVKPAPLLAVSVRELLPFIVRPPLPVIAEAMDEAAELLIINVLAPRANVAPFNDNVVPVRVALVVTVSLLLY